MAEIGRKLAIVGFMCAGKSRLGRLAAHELGWPLTDSDKVLEERLGEPIAAFFDREGEEAFREQEQQVVRELLDAPGPAVIPLGGGAVESEATRAALAEHDVVHVEVALDVAWERTQNHHSDRPLARDRERFARLYAARRPLYESVAGAVLADHAEKTPAFVDALRRGDGRARMVWSAQGYPVWVGAGLLGAAGKLLPDRGRRFVIADERALELHGGWLSGAEAATLTVPSGERHKTLAEAERLLRELARAGMQRSDTIVALGGGMAGDLAGFCAATYQRGVAVAHVPTTLVAQVDSAYGGKTGVDLPEGKNYVGAFHQPSAVLADPAVLATLPDEELSAGFAEVVKTALIAGGALWGDVRELAPLRQVVERDVEALARVVEACARTKLSVVAVDERDTGFRAALNLGHTFAHALESATGYEQWRHGEAVALGLLVALRVSERAAGLDPAVTEDVAGLLERQGLPRAFDGPSPAELLDHMSRDKKRRDTHRNLVLLRSPGDVVIESEAEEDVLVEAIEELRGVIARNRIEVLHGVNLDMLGKRDPQHYGTLTLIELEVRIRHWARALGLETSFFRTNSEAEYVERLHQAPDMADGLLINPGAWTHYSYAIRDALEMAATPAVEVHLSDVDNREEWRRRSVISDLVVGRVSGQGPDGYREGLEILAGELGVEPPSAA